MQIKISAWFSKKLNLGNYENEDFGTSTEFSLEFQPDDNWIEKINQLREELFDDVKKAVFYQIKKRRKEFENEKERQVLEEIDKISKKNRERRKARQMSI